MGDIGQLLTGEIFVVHPRGDYRQILDYFRATNRVLFYGKKLNGPPAFVKRFLFAAKTGVY